MAKMIFVNLPVADLDRSIAFYKSVDAAQNLAFSDATAAMMSFSPEINVMLLTHAKFAEFTPKTIPDAKTSAQMLICISEESRESVDVLIAKAQAAGAVIDPTPKQDYGVMYGRSFEDPDGHIWEVMWMDATAAERGAAAFADA